MKKIFIGIFYGLVGSLFLFDSVCAQLSAQSLQKDLEKGIRELSRPILEKTVSGFEKLLDAKPEDPDLLYLTAKAHFAVADEIDINSKDEVDKSGKSGEHIDAALEITGELLEIDASRLDAWILKYYLLERKITQVGFPRLMAFVGDLRGASAKAKALGPDKVSVLLLTADEASGSMPRPPAAQSIAEYEKVLKKAPGMAEVYYRMGLVYDRAEQPENAKKNYNKAIELDPNHHWAKKRLSLLGK